MQSQLVLADPGFHQQTRYPVLHLYRLPQHQAAVTEDLAPVADLGRCHVALGKEIAAQAVGDLAGIDAIVLPLGSGNRTKHQRMRHLHLRSMGKQMIVDPPGEDRRLHGDHPGLGNSLDPGIQFPPRRSNLAFLVDLARRVLYAKADRLLVHIKSDVIRIVSEEPPWCCLNQRPLSSAFCNTSCSSLT